MEVPNYRRTLRYAAVLCLLESGFLGAGLLIAVGVPSSRGVARVTLVIVGLVTAVRLLLNVPATTVVFLRATSWLKRGGRARVSILNAAVYSGGLFAAVLPAVAFGGVRPTEIPAGFLWLIAACLASPFAPGLRSPFSSSLSAARHAA